MRIFKTAYLMLSFVTPIAIYGTRDLKEETTTPAISNDQRSSRPAAKTVSGMSVHGAMKPISPSSPNLPEAGNHPSDGSHVESGTSAEGEASQSELPKKECSTADRIHPQFH